MTLGCVRAFSPPSEVTQASQGNIFIAVELQNDSSLPTWKGMNLDCASFKAEEERVSEILSGKCHCRPDSESSAVGGTPRSGPSVKPVEILLPEMTEPFSQTKGREGPAP